MKGPAEGRDPAVWWFLGAAALVPEEDGGAKGVCTVAALMLANACLLQRRLRDEPKMKTILRLDKVTDASNPSEVLALAWDAILEKDYPLWVQRG